MSVASVKCPFCRDEVPARYTKKRVPYFSCSRCLWRMFLAPQSPLITRGEWSQEELPPAPKRLRVPDGGRGAVKVPDLDLGQLKKLLRTEHFAWGVKRGLYPPNLPVWRERLWQHLRQTPDDFKKLFPGGIKV